MSSALHPVDELARRREFEREECQTGQNQQNSGAGEDQQGHPEQDERAPENADNQLCHAFLNESIRGMFRS